MTDFVQKLRSTTPTDVLTTGLNSLADGSTALSSALSNETDADMYAIFELQCTFSSAPAAGKGVEIWLVQTVDGTNYEDGSAGAPGTMPSVRLWTFDTRAATTLRRASPKLEIPPRDFKILLRNLAGQAMTASGHTLKMLKISEKSV